MDRGRDAGITLSRFSQLSAWSQLVRAYPRGGVVDRSGHHAGAIGCEQYRAVGRVLGERGGFQHGAFGEGAERVTFNAHILETGTQSYRLRTSKTASRTKNPS
jgi:hypothetical protein